MRRAAIAMMVILFCVSCGPAPTRGRSNNRGTSLLDESTVKMINASQDDVRTAARLALVADVVEAESIDSKVDKIRQALSEGKPCALMPNSVTHSPDNFADGFDKFWIIGDNGAEKCPIALNDSWVSKKGSGEWTLNRSFTSRAKWTEVSPLTLLTAHGSIKVESIPGGQKITGGIEYPKFKLQNMGNVSVNISTSQKYFGHTGGGTLAITIALNGKFSSGIMTWDIQSNAVNYVIDGKASDEKGFNERFSSFELGEIMANSLKMR